MNFDVFTCTSFPFNTNSLFNFLTSNQGSGFPADCCWSLFHLYPLPPSSSPFVLPTGSSVPRGGLLFFLFSSVPSFLVLLHMNKTRIGHHITLTIQVLCDCVTFVHTTHFKLLPPRWHAKCHLFLVIFVYRLWGVRYLLRWQVTEMPANWVT